MVTANDIHQWININLNRSRNHRQKHILSNNANNQQISPKTLLAAQLLYPMLVNESYCESSGIVTSNMIGMDNYIESALYKKLSKITSANLKRITNQLRENGSTSINIPMPVIYDVNHEKHSVENICLSMDWNNYIITPDSSNMISVVINKNPNINIPEGKTLSLQGLLNISYIASAYPSTDQSNLSIDDIPKIEELDLDIAEVLLTYKSGIFKNKPIYEQMALLTSNIDEINDLYPTKRDDDNPNIITSGRTINHYKEEISFINIGHHVDPDNREKSYDVKFNNTGGWYTKHLNLPDYIMRDMEKKRTWSDIREYQGSTKGISELRDKYNQMLDNAPQIENKINRINKQSSNEFEY